MKNLEKENSPQFKDCGLWSLKYRPNKIEDFIFSEENNSVNYFKDVYEGKRRVGNILLCGQPGTGKTTLSLLITKDYDKLFINASDENGVEVIRNKVKDFVLFSSEKKKVVIFDESDYLSHNAQALLRNFIESNPHASFVFTANFIDKIIDPLKSRLQVFKLSKLSKIDIFKNVSNILKNENVTFEKEILAEYIKVYYPDCRKIINEVQKNCLSRGDSFYLAKLNQNGLNINSDDNSLYSFLFTETSGIEKIRTLLSRSFYVNDIFTYCLKEIMKMKDNGKISDSDFLELVDLCSECYYRSTKVDYPEVILSSFILNLDKIIKRL